jgi:hypothetical protein
MNSYSPKEAYSEIPSADCLEEATASSKDVVHCPSECSTFYSHIRVLSRQEKTIIGQHKQSRHAGSVHATQVGS